MKYTSLFSSRDINEKFNMTTILVFCATYICQKLLTWDSHSELGWVNEYKMYTLQTGWSQFQLHICKQTNLHCQTF